MARVLGTCDKLLLIGCVSGKTLDQTEEPMAQMFRCPSCNEIIRLGPETCRFCSAAIDLNLARSAAEELHLATQACAMANNIKTGNYAILVLLAATLILALERAYGHYAPRVFLVSLAGPGAAIAWLWKYGKLKTADPEYPEARRTVLISLGMWAAAVLILACVILWIPIRSD